MNEHKSIELILCILTKIADDIKSNKVFYTTDVEKIVNFLFIYVDKYHRTKEEKAFFPALLSAKIQLENDPISLMINEHTISKGYLKEIKCCIENCKIGSTFSCGRIADCMKNYVALIQHHIQKEETDYFPMANKALSEEAQNEISEQFFQIDKEFSVSFLNEQFMEFLSAMEAKYLNDKFNNQKIDNNENRIYY